MPERLKDMFFTEASLRELTLVLLKSYPGFDAQRFLGLVRDDQWEARELKDRVLHTTRSLAATLPKSYDKALDILLRTIPSVQGFEAMVFPHFVGLYGTDHWELSLDALKRFTCFASSEWAIRPFLAIDPERALAAMRTWADDEDEKVRRLASEGCRPRLPWAPALPPFKKNPRPLLPILERLKDDESEFVRRSVANNLNDISKDHPDLTLEISERWLGRSQRTDWIVKHACRTLLKAGNRRALLLFGYGDPGHLEVSNVFLEKPSLQIGEQLAFGFSLTIPGPQSCKVRLEYAVHFVKSRGSRARKVFKIAERNCRPGTHRFQKKHSFADQSTRRHYPGTHTLSILVNGQEKTRLDLELEKPSLRNRT